MSLLEAAVQNTLCFLFIRQMEGKYFLERQSQGKQLKWKKCDLKLRFPLMRLCGTIPNLLDIEWVGLVFRAVPLKDSGNTSGGCRACAKLSIIPPSTKVAQAAGSRGG